MLELMDPLKDLPPELIYLICRSFT
jgi:hypothetical protein